MSRLTLPSVPRSVAEVRRFTVAICVDSGFGSICDTAALHVSEVATNALIHGSGDVRHHVEPRGDRLHVEVADDADATPVLTDAGPDAEGGRGMALIEALAAEWGVRREEPRGKTVWFELAG